MLAQGISYSGDILADGLRHRFKPEGDRRDNGVYQLWDDDHPAGWAKDYKRDIYTTWAAENSVELTEAERRAWHERRAGIEAERQQAEAEFRVEVRARAVKRWEAAKPETGDHRYLRDKGVGAHGLRTNGNLLHVPVRDTKGTLHGLQLISPDGTKKFLAGTAVRGNYHAIGRHNGCILIAEGYATGATIHQATGHAVAVAFDAGNLQAVAEALRAKFPSCELIVCADDDRWTQGNPGLSKAREAALAVGGKLAIPRFKDTANKPSDFNDLHRLESADVVKNILATAQPAAEPETQQSSEQLRLRAVEIFILSDDSTKPRPRPQTDILIDIGGRVPEALFCGDDDRLYAVISDRHEVWPIVSRRFREWLRGCYFKLVGKGANASSIRDAVETICAKAQFTGERRKVFLRTAEADGKLYIDLTDDAWRVVEIDRDGWRVLDRSPVMFARQGAPAALLIPEHGGSLSELWRFLNLTESDRPLVAGWLLMALSPRGPYPVLVFQGEEGTAKSTVSKILRLLVDPSRVPLRPPTRDERDFLVGAVGNWCVVIDNLSRLHPWLSDAVCRLSTGGGFAARTLYTDCDETAIQIQRPVILNGIDELAVRGDLVSRAIVIQLQPISEAGRREEPVLLAEFGAARPRIFGALLTALAAAIRNVDTVKLARRPRMVDFAKWATAAETEMGFNAGAFLRAYMGNIESAVLSTLESSPVAQALIAHMEGRADWIGTATNLLDCIVPHDSPQSTTWPKTGRGMVSALNRLGPALRRIGIHIECLERSPDAKRTRLIRVCKVPAQPSEPSEPSIPKYDAGFGLDGSKRPDDSIVQEPGQPSATVQKNPNKNNPADDSDDLDGPAGTLHTSAKGWKLRI